MVNSQTSSWQLKKLEDICEVRKGKFDPKKEPNTIYIGLEHIEQQTGRLLGTGDSGETTSIKSIFKTGDVLFGKLRPYLRKYWFATFDGVCATEILPLTPKKGIDSKFLFYIIQQDKFVDYLDQKSYGTKMPRTSWKEMAEYNINLPPLSEQRKIAAILSSVDEAIEKTEAIIEQTEKVKKGLMQQLLTKGIGHTKFKKTEIGEIPEKWEVKKLEEVALFQNGKAHEQYIDDKGKYIIINSKFISSDGTEYKRTNNNLCPLDKGDITMVMSDVPNGKALAKCFLVEENNKYTLNQRICAIKPIKINNEYLYYFLNRNKYYLKFDNGVGQTNLKKNEVLECPILVPPIKEQECIVRILKLIDSKLNVEKKRFKNLIKVKKGLMQALLTGKVRVKVDDEVMSQ